MTIESKIMLHFEGDLWVSVFAAIVGVNGNLQIYFKPSPV